ncbi:hypothetical protein SLE2022_234380 [Rubroshorea leprosula]
MPTFGAYTPCGMDTLVISISHLVHLGLRLYWIWLIKRDAKAQRLCLRSNCYNCMLGLLAGYCVAEPLSRSAIFLYISMVLCEALFGILLLVYVPNLNPYPSYSIMQTESLDNDEYEALPEGEHICPERQANISSISKDVGLKKLKERSPGF